MISAIQWFLKVMIFSLLVLILGNWIKIGNKTVSDQIKTEMAHAERSPFAGKVRNWADQITQDTRFGHKKKATFKEETSSENIAPSERQKLKSLIEELNRPSSR